MFLRLLAIAFLTAPVDAPDPDIPVEMHAQLRGSMQELAIHWEILDPRELRYVLIRPEDFASDVKLLRSRFHDLARTPLLDDAQRFPDRKVVSDFLAFNRAYRQNLELRQPLELPNWWELREALQETDRLYQLWDTVRDARCEYYYVTVRRKALKQLRDMLGEEAYFAGVLPPHVPLWHFKRIDP